MGLCRQPLRKSSKWPCPEAGSPEAKSGKPFRVRFQRGRRRVRRIRFRVMPFETPDGHRLDSFCRSMDRSKSRLASTSGSLGFRAVVLDFVPPSSCHEYQHEVQRGRVWATQDGLLGFAGSGGQACRTIPCGFAGAPDESSRAGSLSLSSSGPFSTGGGLACTVRFSRPDSRLGRFSPASPGLFPRVRPHVALLIRPSAPSPTSKSADSSPPE